MNALVPGALDALLPAMMSEPSDAALLSLRAELLAATAAMSVVELADEITDEDSNAATTRLSAAIDAVVDAPLARTSAGQALKAAAAMLELRLSYDARSGGWQDAGPELIWNVLSEIAGDAYVPPTLPALLQDQEPPRRPWSKPDTYEAAAPPDAELITLCARFDAIEARHYSAFAAAREDDEAQDRAMGLMKQEHQPLLDRIVELPPTSLAGAVALARTLWQWTHADFARGECTDDRLARALLLGLTRSAADDTDAYLIELCTAGEAAEDQSNAIWGSAKGAAPGSNELEAAYDESLRIYETTRAAMAEVLPMMPTTAAGLSAKAALALRQLECDEHQQPLAASVLRQIAGRATA